MSGAGSSECNYELERKHGELGFAISEFILLARSVGKVLRSLLCGRAPGRVTSALLNTQQTCSFSSFR